MRLWTIGLSALDAARGGKWRRISAGKPARSVNPAEPVGPASSTLIPGSVFLGMAILLVIGSRQLTRKATRTSPVSEPADIQTA